MICILWHVATCIVNKEHTYILNDSGSLSTSKGCLFRVLVVPLIFLYLNTFMFFVRYGHL